MNPIIFDRPLKFVNLDKITLSDDMIGCRQYQPCDVYEAGHEDDPDYLLYTKGWYEVYRDALDPTSLIWARVVEGAETDGKTIVTNKAGKIEVADGSLLPSKFELDKGEKRVLTVDDNSATSYWKPTNDSVECVDIPSDSSIKPSADTVGQCIYVRKDSFGSASDTLSGPGVLEKNDLGVPLYSSDYDCIGYSNGYNNISLGNRPEIDTVEKFNAYIQADINKYVTSGKVDLKILVRVNDSLTIAKADVDVECPYASSINVPASLDGYILVTFTKGILIFKKASVANICTVIANAKGYNSYSTVTTTAELEAAVNVGVPVVYADTETSIPYTSTINYTHGFYQVVDKGSSADPRYVWELMSTSIDVDPAGGLEEGTDGLKIKDLGVTTAKIANKAVTTDKVNPGTSGQVLTTNSSGSVIWETPGINSGSFIKVSGYKVSTSETFTLTSEDIALHKQGRLVIAASTGSSLEVFHRMVFYQDSYNNLGSYDTELCHYRTPIDGRGYFWEFTCNSNTGACSTVTKKRLSLS